MHERANRACTGIKESDTGLSAPSLWDLVADQQMLQQEQPLQVARNTKIINADSDEPQYVINIKQIAKYVVKLGEKVSPTDIEEGMRVGVDRVKYQIQVRIRFQNGLGVSGTLPLFASLSCHPTRVSHAPISPLFCASISIFPSKLALGECADSAAAQD